MTLNCCNSDVLRCRTHVRHDLVLDVALQTVHFGALFGVCYNAVQLRLGVLPDRADLTALQHNTPPPHDTR